MGTGLEIGKTGILTAQQAMLTAGNNISNANTPGFSKRTAILSAESPIKDPSGFFIGRGVKMADIRRETAEFLTVRVFEKQAALSNAEARNIRLADLEGLFNELSEFGLKNTISDFFGSVHEVAKTPDILSVRTQMVEKAHIVTQTFNQMDNDLDDMLLRVRDDIKTTVKEVNNITKQVADLNVKITSLGLSSLGTPGDLEDQRDVLLNDLSKLIDADVKLSGDGLTKNVTYGGREIVGGGTYLLLSTSTDVFTGDVSVTFKSDGVFAAPLNGGLKGLVDFQVDVNVYKSELDKLAKAMIDEFNRVHSEGINFNGSFGSEIMGINGVSDSTVALNTPGLLSFTPSSGDIYVTVTDTSSGTVTKTKVSLDVATDSLDDLALALDGIANISSSVAVSGSNSFLKIDPDSGFTVDFSSSIDPNPDLTSFTGASVTMGGYYTGSDNDVYEFTVLGAGGTVGKTAGLQIEVTDLSGTVLQTVEVGDNYVPGTTIDIVDGIKMTLSNGVISGGDDFSIDVLNDPDETNLLAALGVNSFFSGTSAKTIDLDSNIKKDPSSIAGASSNSLGDNTNLLRMADLEFKKVNDKDTLAGRSFGEFLTETAAQIGSESNLSKITMDTERKAHESLKNLKEQIVGVSIDEELSNLLKFEHMYNASARFISVVNDSIDRILQI